jgi:hypothetical protein
LFGKRAAAAAASYPSSAGKKLFINTPATCFFDFFFFLGIWTAGCEIFFWFFYMYALKPGAEVVGAFAL